MNFHKIYRTFVKLISLSLAMLWLSPMAAWAVEDPVPGNELFSVLPPVYKTEDGQYQLGDMDLGPFGISPLDEFLDPPVQDPAAAEVEEVVLRNITYLRDNLPQLIEKLKNIEDHPELTDEGLVSLFSEFVEILNGSMPTRELVVETIEVTRSGLLDLNQKLQQLSATFNQTPLEGTALTSLESVLPLVFGGDACSDRVGGLANAMLNNTMPGAELLALRESVSAQCGTDEDMSSLRARILASEPGVQPTSATQSSSLVAPPTTELPGLDGLLKLDAVSELLGIDTSAVTDLLGGDTGGSLLDLTALNDTTRSLYDFTGQAGLPFAWIQIQDATIPWVPGAALPLVTEGPHGLELLLIRLEPTVRLTSLDQGNVLEAVANGSILFDAGIRIVVERPMASQLVNFLQSHELLRGLLESQSGAVLTEAVLKAAPLGSLLDPVTQPILGDEANLTRILEEVADGNISAILELILRRFPTVLALVPGGEVVPVSGQDIASLLGYDIEGEFSDGSGVCEAFPISATAYVQLDRSSTGNIFFARFSGNLPKRVEAVVGSNSNLNLALNTDVAVGASITLQPVCAPIPLDDDLKSIFGDLDATLGTNLLGIYDVTIPPDPDREAYLPVVNDPPEGDEFRMGPFSAAPEFSFLELSAGLMSNAFVLEEPDARYLRFALELPIGERFSLGVQAGVENGEIFAQAGVDPGLYVALAAYTKNIIGQLNIPIIDDANERLLAVLQLFGLGEAFRLEAGADQGGDDGLFADWQLIDPITEVNLAVPLFAGIRAQWGIYNVPEFVGLCLSPGPICPNSGYDSNHQDVVASFRMEMSQEAYPYFAVLTREGGFVLGSFMTTLGSWVGFNFEEFFSRSNRFYFGFDTDGYSIGGDTALIRCGTNADSVEDAYNGLCSNIIGLSIGGWIKGQVIELIDPFNQEALESLINQVLDFFINIGEFIIDIFTSLLENVILVIANDIGVAVSQIYNNIGGALGIIDDAAEDIFLGKKSVRDVAEDFVAEILRGFPPIFNVNQFLNFINDAETAFNEFVDNFSFDLGGFSPIVLHGSMGCSADRTGLDLDLELLIPDIESAFNSLFGNLFGGSITLPGFLQDSVASISDFIENLSNIAVGLICTGNSPTNPNGIHFFSGDGIVADTGNNADSLLGGIPLVGTGVDDLLGSDSILDGALGDDGIDSLPVELGPVQDVVGGLLGGGDDGNPLLPEPVMQIIAAALGDESQGSVLDPTRLGPLVDSVVDPDGSGEFPLSPNRVTATTRELLQGELPLSDVPLGQVVDETLSGPVTVLEQLPLGDVPVLGEALTPVTDAVGELPLGDLGDVIDTQQVLGPVSEGGLQLLDTVEQSPVSELLVPVNDGANGLGGPIGEATANLQEVLLQVPLLQNPDDLEGPLAPVIEQYNMLVPTIVGPEIPGQGIGLLNTLLGKEGELTLYDQINGLLGEEVPLGPVTGGPVLGPLTGGPVLGPLTGGALIDGGITGLVDKILALPGSSDGLDGLFSPLQEAENPAGPLGDILLVGLDVESDGTP